MPITLLRPSQVLGVPIGANVDAIVKADNTAASFSNSAAENTLWTVSVPAIPMGINDALRVFLYGTILNNSGATRTLTFRLKYGGTTIVSIAAQPVTSGTTFGYVFDGIIANIGATNSQKGVARVSLANNTGSGAPVTGQGTAAIDSTLAETLALTVQADVGTATQTYAQILAILEYIKAA